MFQDRARIQVLAGRGGDGGLSFRREKHVPRGGPDGGDGGRGGDVVLAADERLRDLASFRAKTRFMAGAGEPGRGARKHGADGADVALRVPVGTQAFGPEGELIADLDRPDSRIVLARGGAGGRGNQHFATPVRQTPRFAEVGEPGGHAEVELRLKLLADAAMAGLPNAGKSSLLRRLSNATPKVADYPFTTLAPVLGTVESPDGAQLTVADVPGLIEGASEGIGLGHEFLAHLERARLLLHVIDSSEEDVEERFRTIDTELALYGAGLDERPQILVLNKTDLVPEPPAADVADPRIVAVVAVSAATGAGLDDLRRELFAAAERAGEPEPARPDAEELADYLVYRPQPPRRRPFRIFRGDGAFRVTGPAAADLPADELRAALKAAGAKAGDPVQVGERTFSFE